MAIWFDVDDLVRYYCFNVRPTGIQRLSLALFQALQTRAAAGEAIYFCRRQARRRQARRRQTGRTQPFRAVDFPALEARLRALIDTPPAASQPVRPRRAKPQWVQRLPAQKRASLGRIRKAAVELSLAVLNFFTPAPPQGQFSEASLFDVGDDIIFAPGDWLINVGSSWNMPYQPECLQALRESGAKFGVLVYDMIPELFPEWTAPVTLPEFRAWVRELLPQADLLLAISDNTARDITDCLTRAGKSVPPIARVQVGGPAPDEAGQDLTQLCRPFVLMVSTFEVRKNHALMFRVWQALAARHSPAHIPDLIFAGKPGWLTGDLLCQLENAGWLGGKIKFHENPTDSELALLYRQCLFTVYPSLYEGWGLPVCESLAHGKLVAASNRASIPEAGGDFCVYFDPENIQQAMSVIEELIRHPERVAALERHIALNYRPPTWHDAADSLLNALLPIPSAKLREPGSALIVEAA